MKTKKKQSKSVPLAVRLDDSQARFLAVYARELSRLVPGRIVTPSDALRACIAQAMEPSNWGTLMSYGWRLDAAGELERANDDRALRPATKVELAESLTAIGNGVFSDSEGRPVYVANEPVTARALVMSELTDA